MKFHSRVVLPILVITMAATSGSCDAQQLQSTTKDSEDNMQPTAVPKLFDDPLPHTKSASKNAFQWGVQAAKAFEDSFHEVKKLTSPRSALRMMTASSLSASTSYSRGWRMESLISAMRL